jgi:outer membrane protein with beta-barrel domain
MRTITVSVFALVASVMVPASAVAQMTWTDKGYASVNVGGQAGSHTLTTAPAFRIYDEDGSLATSQKAGGGGFVDLSGGYRVRRNLLVAVGFSHSGSSDDVTINAQVPDPARFERLRSVDATLPDAKHSENAVHFSAVWMVPVTDKIDVGVSAGPSVFMVKQDLATGLTITEPGPTVTSVTSAESKKTVAGFNLGVDVTYLLTKKIGAGVLARYAGGSVKLPDAAKSLGVGGFQFGVGLRYRF